MGNILCIFLSHDPHLWFGQVVFGRKGETDPCLEIPRLQGDQGELSTRLCFTFQMKHILFQVPLKMQEEYQRLKSQEFSWPQFRDSEWSQTSFSAYS